MLIDGKQIANEFQEKLRKHAALFPRKPVLAIVIVGKNPVIENFVRIKKSFGESIGVQILEFYFEENISGERLQQEVEILNNRSDVHGIVVQLPLPKHVDMKSLLDTISITKDVDVLSQSALVAFANGTGKILPPVAGAVQEIFERNKISVEGKEVLMLGYGHLVGKPISILLRHNHAHLTVIDKPVSDLEVHARESDIIICGVGSPRLITALMVRPDTILIDAGTSESGGKIVGDIDPACHDIVALSTPTPGGVGPIAVAMLFKNLLMLAKQQDTTQ